MKKRPFVLTLFPVNKFNTGRDLTATVTVGGQVIRQFGLHSSTKINPQWREERETPTNNGGVPVSKNIFEGYEVVIDATRQSGVVDWLQQFLQDNYYAGNPDPVVTLLKTVRNDDGSVDQENYVDGTIHVPDLGDFSGVAKVKQQIKMFFTRKLSVVAQVPITVSGGNIPTAVAQL